MKRSLAALLLICCLLSLAECAREVIVRERPPSARVEVIEERPSREHIWIPGHWRWEGEWVWVRGHWEIPPRERAEWVAGRWAERPGGWVWVEGHWR